MNSKKIIFIVGPTAVGKSELSFCLAQKVKGEIVSCDSMQVYREVQVASNKPSSQTLKKIPHHLIDVVSVEDDFDVVRFNKLAVAAIKDIHKRGHVPIIVGGSGLYMQILLDGIFEAHAGNADIRNDLKQKAKEMGNQFLYDKLKIKDPKAAEQIHPNDIRRVIRALEDYMIENKPLSQIQKNRLGLWGQYPISLFVLNRERAQLYELINQRVEEMFDRGIVDEVQKLSKMEISQTAQGIIGMKEIRGFLNGEYDLKHTKDLMKLHTRHLAKRQLTWFRKDKRAQWIMMGPADHVEKVCEQLIKEINN